MSLGTDKLKLNQNLLLSIPMFEGTGTVSVKDVAKPHHPMTLVNSPAWYKESSGLYTLSFTHTSSHKITSPGALCADMAFTTESFSGVIWVNWTTLPNTSSNVGTYIDKEGVANSTGWGLTAWPDIYGDGFGIMTFLTNPSGGQAYARPSCVANTWYLFGWTKVGTVCLLYCNGVDVTISSTTLATLGTAANLFCIGARTNATQDHFGPGRLWEPRVWNRALLPSEHMEIFNRERTLFGV